LGDESFDFGGGGLRSWERFGEEGEESESFEVIRAGRSR